VAAATEMTLSSNTVRRVAIVEDNARFRATLETFVREVPGFVLARSYGSATVALRDLAGVQAAGGDPPWDLVLMDLELPDLGGIAATRQLKAAAPAVLVVVLTVFEDAATIVEAISAGADGYLVKRISAPELRAQLSSIIREGAPMTPGVARTLLTFVRESTPGASPPGAAPTRLDLTDREQDVLRCIVRGRSYQQTADDLAIGLETVRTHVRSLYRKLRVHSVAEAVGLAIRRRLI
jgi:DNA-binding NarL/FixJ family response regulator